MAVSKGTIRRYGSRGGGGGGGGTRFYEGDLPDADKAPKKTILVRESDNTKWRVGYRTIDTVDAVISVEDFSAPVSVVFFGVYSDVSNLTETDDGYAVEADRGWLYKPTGSLQASLTEVDAPSEGSYPFQGVFDGAPTNIADAASYADDSTSEFFKKEAGATNSSLDTEDAALLDTGSYTNRGPLATAPTDTADGKVGLHSVSAKPHTRIQ